MIVQDRDSSRGVFVQTWQKFRRGEALGALEQIVIAVVMQHPEYHRWLNEDGLHTDFISSGERENPFLHMGMHIAIQEQISSDRPPGSAACYRGLLETQPDEHKLHHRMMECLGRVLWQAQRDRTMPDELSYLECLRKLR